MNDPFVSIVILNWNGWVDTIECLDSLGYLKYEPFEIIVVDNASTDDSVKQIKSRFPEVKVIENSENSGFSKGNNLGIRLAMNGAAKYVWLLNNDTTVSDTALKELVETAENNPLLGIVGSVLYEYDQPGVVQAWGGGDFNVLLSTTSHYKFPSNKIEHIIGASMFIRRQVLEEVGMLDETFFFFMEDTEYSRRVKSLGWQLGVANRSRVYHKGGASIKSDAGSKKSIESDRFYIKAVGIFMGLSKIPVALVALRLFIILARRIVKGQINRIPILTNDYLKGYFLGREKSYFNSNNKDVHVA